MRVRHALVIAVLLASLAALPGCAPARAADAGSAVIEASGRVRDDAVTVNAPVLRRPAFDPTVGLPVARAARPAGAPRAATLPTISATLVSVTVAPGDAVAAGALIARLDDREQVAGALIARRAAERAHAQADVLTAKLGELDDTAATLRRNRASVTAALASGRAGRATLVARIAQLEAVVASLPPLPAPIPVPGPDPRVLLPQLRTKLAELDAGLAKARAGLARIDAGSTRLADARATLTGARRVVRAAAEAADAGVPLADAERARTLVSAPCTGAVLWVAEPGTVLMADAPLARLRPDGPARVDTYLDARTAARVRPGDPATVRLDSLPGRELAATVTAIRPVVEYPPTFLPTNEIHLLRAVRVTVSLDDARVTLPAGTPADLTIHASQR